MREYREIQSLSADMVGLLGMNHRAVPWRGVLPHDFGEGALFPGFTILALGAIASSVAVRRGVMPHQGVPQEPAPASVWSRRLFAGFAVLTAIVLAHVWTGPWSWHFGPLPLPPFRPYQLFSVAAILLLAGVLLTDSCRRAWSSRDVVLFYAAAVVTLWFIALGPEPE